MTDIDGSACKHAKSWWTIIFFITVFVGFICFMAGWGKGEDKDYLVCPGAEGVVARVHYSEDCSYTWMSPLKNFVELGYCEKETLYWKVKCK